jgi:cellulose synthase/poly-beta-1,6-N-acetylglucosamine synthase-like glycosyltransferase
LTETIHILLWVLACVVAAPLWVLSLQCLLGFLPTRRRTKPDADTPRLAVLIPAHNEEGVIAVTLESLKTALPGAGLIVVVADNCTDKTADIARGHGVTVLERTDTVNRGKGFALATGLASLENEAPDIVIIVDADCTVSSDTLTELAKTAQSTGRPVQGVYLLRAPDTHDARAVVSAFAFMVKNQARPRGMDLLGFPIPLTGSGMAFPYPLLKQANLATGNIVEDLALGLELAEQGHGPVLCDAARITGALPGTGDAAVTQRTRWEHGYLSTLLSTAPRLFFKGLFRFRPALIAAAIDLAVPPLSLLVMGAVAALTLSLIIGWWITAFGPALLIASSLMLAATMLVVSWAVYVRRWLPFSAFLAIPGYILWKLPIYLKFLTGREKAWVRTERDPAPANPSEQAGNGTSGG